MYNSQPVRHLAQALAVNSQYIPGPYDPFSGYHHFPGIAEPPASAWNSVYAPREEFPFGYGTGSSPSGGQVSFSSAELTVPPSAGGGASFSTYDPVSDQESFIFKKRPQESIRPTASGKTRTKDKYRVVYTDKQRMELEREFQSNRYITMRRKAELSITLGLSERQIKIWFQNRRAKERKMNRKKLQHSQQASTTTPASPGLAEPVEAHPGMSPNGFFSDTLSKEY
ncbi:homeobox protein CDX-1a isoform X2 [Takifugu rubripes]|uniref:homeobox protein CDX-1a isoform X2 n=1 Tax=Takifugu rubripes TaxID=31033 RepID=UPI000298BA74|nr:homeobox protein CDX-1 isoform X2 [Takifugu rubripes]|eukprot:XP_003970425.1 PREDICTED: homeobox protein CDX-1 [Takifugu rubripes]